MKEYLKLAYSLHFKKCILATVYRLVSSTVLLSMAENYCTQFALTTCKMQKQTVFSMGDFWTFG